MLKIAQVVADSNIAASIYMFTYISLETVTL